MRFRGAMSFNTQDTGFSLGERITVNPGVEYRCELVLQSLLKHRKAVDAEVLTEEINTTHNCLYSMHDIRYALGRLQKEGFIYAQSKGCFRTVARAQAAWDRLEKKTI